MSRYSNEMSATERLKTTQSTLTVGSITLIFKSSPPSNILALLTPVFWLWWRCFHLECSVFFFFSFLTPLDVPSLSIYILLLCLLNFLSIQCQVVRIVFNHNCLLLGRQNCPQLAFSSLRALQFKCRLLKLNLGSISKQPQIAAVVLLLLQARFSFLLPVIKANNAGFVFSMIFILFLQKAFQPSLGLFKGKENGKEERPSRVFILDGWYVLSD